MQKGLLLIGAIMAILLTSACNEETNTLYYSIMNGAVLSDFDDAINTEGELKGPICKVSVDASNTKILVQIAESGHKIDRFSPGEVFFVLTDGQEKLLLLNVFIQVQLADNTIFQLSDDSEHQMREEMRKLMPLENCRQN